MKLRTPVVPTVRLEGGGIGCLGDGVRDGPFHELRPGIARRLTPSSTSGTPHKNWRLSAAIKGRKVRLCKDRLAFSGRPRRLVPGSVMRKVSLPKGVDQPRHLYFDGAAIEHFKAKAGNRAHQKLINEALKRGHPGQDLGTKWGV